MPTGHTRLPVEPEEPVDPLAPEELPDPRLPLLELATEPELPELPVMLVEPALPVTVDVADPADPLEPTVPETPPLDAVVAADEPRAEALVELDPPTDPRLLLEDFDELRPVDDEVVDLALEPPALPEDELPLPEVEDSPPVVAELLPAEVLLAPVVPRVPALTPPEELPEVLLAPEDSEERPLEAPLEPWLLPRLPVAVPLERLDAPVVAALVEVVELAAVVWDAVEDDTAEAADDLDGQLEGLESQLTGGDVGAGFPHPAPSAARAPARTTLETLHQALATQPPVQQMADPAKRRRDQNGHLSLTDENASRTKFELSISRDVRKDTPSGFHPVNERRGETRAQPDSGGGRRVGTEAEAADGERFGAVSWGMASYTEQQLSEVTGLGGEAVRRYFEVGLVAPRADGIYDDAVRARLVAIDRLKTVRGVRSIELIREALDAMSAAQIQEFIAATGDKAPSSDGKGRDDDAPRTAVLTRVRPSGPAPEVAPDKAPTASFGAVKARDDLPFAHTDALPVASVMLPSLVPQWSRIELVQGVELHIRADIGGEAQRLVDELRQRFTR